MSDNINLPVKGQVLFTQVWDFSLTDDNDLQMSTPDIRLQRSRGSFLSPQFILGLIIAAAAIRISWLGGRSLWYDELYTVWASKLPIKSAIREAAASGHPPLYYLLGHFWFAIYSSGDVWARLLPWGAGVITVGVVYLIGKELFDRNTGLWACMLVAFSPVLVWYSREATSYSWLVFLSVVFFWLIVRSAKRGGFLNWSGYVIAGVAACMIYYLGPILILAGWPVYWLLQNRKRGEWKWWLAGQAGLVAAALVISLMGQAKLASRWLVLSWPSPGLFLRGLLQIPVVFISGDWIINDLNYGASVLGLPGIVIFLLALAAVMGALAVIIFSRSTRQGFISREAAAVAIFAFLLLIGPIMADAVMGRLPAARFYLWAAPPLSLLAAVALASAPRRFGLLAGIAVLAVLLGLTVTELKFDDNKVGDWRALMATVSANRRQNDLLYCFPLHMCTVAASFYLPEPMPLAGGFPAIDSDSIFFAAKGVPWNGYRSGYFTGSGAQLFSWTQAQERIAADVAGYSRVWLVDSDNSYGGSASTSLRLQTLEKNWRLVGEWDFPGNMLLLFVHK